MSWRSISLPLFWGTSWEPLGRDWHGLSELKWPRPKSFEQLGLISLSTHLCERSKNSLIFSHISTPICSCCFELRVVVQCLSEECCHFTSWFRNKFQALVKTQAPRTLLLRAVRTVTLVPVWETYDIQSPNAFHIMSLWQLHDHCIDEQYPYGSDACKICWFIVVRRLYDTWRSGLLELRDLSPKVRTHFHFIYKLLKTTWRIHRSAWHLQGKMLPVNAQAANILRVKYGQ